MSKGTGTSWLIEEFSEEASEKLFDKRLIQHILVVVKESKNNLGKTNIHLFLQCSKENIIINIKKTGRKRRRKKKREGRRKEGKKRARESKLTKSLAYSDKTRRCHNFQIPVFLAQEPIAVTSISPEFFT